ncbi:hypothetical protein [Litoreibacter arenae]|uniref:Translation initiation factor 2 n=1 Tax=Litoreibacter arenae DSM 19593 TaxID=1123360 RepID=S9RSZ9_9RHOB|nr:hypothetical protein [Litoreibacter arenae]EPX81185.1 hypothetical protein thalar_00634 [Litoreibacter arenae DSM 19593]
MKPNFALNLSEDGIVLLHRHPSGGGWVDVGEAPLDSDDLGAALAALRDKAEALEGPGFATKLILPPSQLLYAKITVDGDVKTDVEEALAERTPYAASELSYDISGEPPEVQVVAVARETLAEAEAFLGPYNFNPVGFSANPDPSHFVGIPNLGPLPSKGGDGVPKDDKPLTVLSPDEVAALAAPASKEDAAPRDPLVLSNADAPPDRSGDDEPVKAPAKQPSEDATPTAAAFSSRRKPSLGPAKDISGEIVTSKAPRIAVPKDEVRKSPEAKKPPKVEPRVKTGEAAKKKAAPPIVPPKAATKKNDKKKKSRNLGTSVAALRGKSKAAAKPTEQPTATKPISVKDPIAELAAKQAAGKPRFLGLILTAILLVALLIFAALSSYLLPENAVSRLLRGDETETTSQDNVGLQEEPVDVGTSERLASLPRQDTGDAFTIPSEEEIAESEEPEPEFELPPTMSRTEAETAYAVSGVWQLAPDLRTEMTQQDLDDLYESSLDPDLTFEDAPALASFDTAAQALDFEVPSSPPAASILFNLDSRGLVKPAPDGAENPDGILVFSGPPPVLPLQRPGGVAPLETLEPDEPEQEAPAENPLAGFKPTQRPSDLQERRERAAQGGLSNAELASIRPQVRPDSAQAVARAEAIARALAEAEADTREAEAQAAAEAAAQAELDRPTAQAVARSLRPDSRPRNFARIVARAQQVPAQQRTAAAASTAAVSRGNGPAVARSSRAAPTGTTRASVARAATDNNAISLGKVALVGVFGTSSNRRALVRLPNGRFKKVGVGDSIDGGRIAAIGEGQLRYTKRGRTLTLEMPNG